MTEPSKVMTDEEAGKILAEAWISDPIGLTLTRLQLEDEFRAEDAMTDPSKRAREYAKQIAGNIYLACSCSRQLCEHWQACVATIIDSAIADERERCAKMADHLEQGWRGEAGRRKERGEDVGAGGMRETANAMRRLAAAIRNAPEGEK